MASLADQTEAAVSKNLLLGYMGGMFPAMMYLSIRVVNMYAETDFPRHTFMTLYVAFFCSFSMFMLIPIDIASTVRDRNAAVQNDSTSKYKDDTGMLSTVYYVFYVVLLLWNNLVLAMQEYYNTDGYFTPGTRGKSSFRRWANDTIPAIVIGLIVLGILIGGKEVPSSPTGLKIVMVTLTTLIYETILMFLLGYGYVELPKMLWNQSNHETQLQIMQARAATDFTAFQVAQTEVQKVSASVLKTKEKIGGGGEAQVQEALSIMLAECPQEFKSARMGEVAADKAGKVTVDTLAALRTRLNITKAAYRMAQARLENTQLGSYICEDLVDAKNRNNRRSDKFDGVKVIHWQLKGYDSTAFDYRWHLELRPKLCRIAAVCCGVLSLLSIIGGMSSLKGVPKQSSIFFLIVHMPTNTRGGIAFFIALTFSYSVLVALWSLLQLKSLGFELVMGRTTSYSLSACFRMVASLAFPLTFFYLGWIGENGIEKEGQWMYFSELRNRTSMSFVDHTRITGFNYTKESVYDSKLRHNVTHKHWYNTTETVAIPTLEWKLEPDYMPAAFAKFYQLPPSTNSAFSSLYPVMLLIFIILFMLKAYNRLMVCLKMPAYQFGDPVVTKEQLDEGMKSLNKYRKIAQRTAQRHEVSKKRSEKHADRSIRMFGILLWKRETLNEAEERSIKEAREKERSAKKAASNKGGDSSKPTSEKDIEDDDETLRLRAEKAAAEHIHVNLPQPAHLTGTMHIRWLKNTTEGPKEGWVEVYMEVRPPGTLYIVKDVSCTDAVEPILDPSLPKPIELDSVISCKASSKADSQERVAVRLDQADSSLKLRLPSSDEARHWADRLNEWKDFCVLYKQEVEAVKAHRRREVERRLDEEAHAKFYAAHLHDAHDEGVSTFSDSGKNSSRKSFSSLGRASFSSLGRASFSGMSAKVFAPKEPMTINPMRLAGSAAARYDMNSRAQYTTDVNLEVKPDTVEGWLELKNFTPVWFGNKYKKYYFRIDDNTNSMQYFHSDADCEDGRQPVGFLDLKLADEALMSIKYKDARDLDRFICKVGSLTYYFKAPHHNETKLWVRLINLWREYLLIKYATSSAERVFAIQKIIESRTASQEQTTVTSDSEKDEDENMESTKSNPGDHTILTVTAETEPLTTDATSAISTEIESATIKDEVDDDELIPSPPSETASSSPSPSPSPFPSSSLTSSFSPPSTTVAETSQESIAAVSGRPGRLKVSPRVSQSMPRSLLEATGIAEVELGLLRAESKQKKRASMRAAGVGENKGEAATRRPGPPM